MGIIETAAEILQFTIGEDVPPIGAERSSDWGPFRDECVEKHPFCAFCGKTEDLNAHHKVPFWLGGAELDPDNVIILCRGSVMNCHFVIGHLWNWSAFNPLVDAECEIWRFRFQAARVLTPMAKQELETIREALKKAG